MASTLLAIKLGSTTTTIYREGEGLVLREPSMIATIGIKSREIKAVGKEAKTIANTVKNKTENIEVYSFDNNVDASNLLKKLMKERDVILIKASHGMHFEEIVEAIK